MTRERELLHEFVADVEAVGIAHVKEDWPDLYVTYQSYLQYLNGNTTLVRCDNCRKIHTLRTLTVRLPDIPNLTQRIDIGGEVPAGECPSCGCLVYLIKKGQD